MLYVVGLEEDYWRENGFGRHDETVDVRKFMPRDPGAGKSLRRKSFCDVVVHQGGFVASVVEVVSVAMLHGRCIVGAYYHPHPTSSHHSIDRVKRTCPYWAMSYLI